MKSTKIIISCPADLVFAPTLAFTRFSEDLLLRYAMITAASCSAAYVDPFARTWPGFSTTDPDSVYILYGIRRVGKGEINVIYVKSRPSHFTFQWFGDFHSRHIFVSTYKFCIENAPWLAFFYIMSTITYEVSTVSGIGRLTFLEFYSSK